MNPANLSDSKLLKLMDIVRSYDKFEQEMKDRGIDLNTTSKGDYCTKTDFQAATDFLNEAKKKKLIETRGPIAHIYPGDGRMLPIFDLYGFKPVIGIEGDKKLYDASRYVIADLEQRHVVRYKNIRIIHGDFTNPEAYELAEKPFEEIPYFYMGADSKPLKRLAKKIKEESPEGTKLIVHGLFVKESEEPNIALKLEKKFPASPLGDFLIYVK